MSLETIKRLVGDAITKENLSFVDSYIYKWFGIFIPIGGNCAYAITPSHTHPSYMFVVSYDDQSTIYVADKRFESYPQSMFCLSPNIPHHEIQNYIPPKHCALFIDEIRFQKALQLYTNEPFSFDTKTVNIQNSHIDTYIKKFINESHNTHLSRSIILENTASLLTHEIIRTILGFGANNTQTIQNQKLNIVIQHINSNYEKELSLGDLATLSTLSKSHFLKLFSASLDMTPMAYLTHIRLQNAKKMLLSHKLTITDISRQCGFNSPSYFTTSSTKSVGKQIQHNSKSELCYLKADFSKMLRIETNLKIIDDKKIKQHLIDTKDYLKGFDRDDPTFLLFTLCDSKATFWTIEDNRPLAKLKKVV